MLELKAIECVRSGRTLFSGLSATLPAGKLMYVQGPNGAGKSSLLRLICGLLLPAQGEVAWRGQSIASAREDFGRELIYLGHAAALKDDLTASENLLMASRLSGWNARPADARSALAQAGLGGRERTAARALSQGQRRRVSLARLALKGPQSLWILDEPFNALDTAATEWLSSLMQGHLDRGGCVVLTSHQDVALTGRIDPLRIAL